MHKLKSTRCLKSFVVEDLSVGSSSVNLLVGMSRNKSDGALRHQLLDRLPCQRSSNPQTVRQHGRGHQLELRNLRQQLVVRALVEQHHVVHLLLLLALAPLLLLLLAAAALGRLGGSRRLLLLRSHNADERGAWGRRERETETERGMYYYYRGEGRAGRSEGELKGEPSFLRAVALTDEIGRAHV